MSQQASKDTIVKINNILHTNMKDSNIPSDKVDAVFQQIDSLIPADIRSVQPVLTFFNN